MQSAYYRIYLQQVFNLAKTMVVKSEVAANAINSELELFGEVIGDDPYNWKYYINLAGLYHTTDTMMTVTSMDTLEEIDFTLENLAIHRATASAHVYGSRYYRDLVERYPTQENLILGILNPIPLDVSINSKDGEILYYDRSLVEYQEITLISRLQKWINAYMTRWNVSGYGVTDEYYPAAHLGVMYSQLPMEILNCRLESCKTNEVHSFHLREYFASNGGLDKHLPYMTIKQALFLYRNIKYLQNHAGKTETFNILLEKIMTDRNLPLSRYDIVHIDKDQSENLLPEIEMHREALNIHPGDGSSNERTVSEVMSKQYGVARSNYEEHYEVLDNVTMMMKHSKYDKLPSKVFESALLDTTDSVPYTKEESLLNHWIYLATNNRFNAIVNIANPITGVSMALSAKEAFIIFLYAFNKARGVTLDTIPTIIARRVRKPSIPQVSELKELVNSEIVDDVTLATLRDTQPNMGVYLSVEAFQEFSISVHHSQNYQRLIYSNHENHFGRGMLEAAASYLYNDIECDLGYGEVYDDWFDVRGFDFTELSLLDLDLLANNIISAVTGSDISSTTALADLQKNMLQLMTKLSSYSVHYLQSINTTSYRILDNVVPRVSYIEYATLTGQYVDIARIKPLSSGLSSHHFNRVPKRGIGPLSLSNSKGESRISIDLGSNYVLSQQSIINRHVSLGDVNVLNMEDNINV